MSIPISPGLQAAILASKYPGAILTFLTFYHLTFPGDHYYRVVYNKENVVRGGHTYNKYAFIVERPVDQAGQVNEAKLTIDAVDLSYIAMIRSIRVTDVRIKVNIVIALASDPDASPAVDLGTFEWKNITYNKNVVSGDLVYSDRLNSLVPSLMVTPINVSGSF